MHFYMRSPYLDRRDAIGTMLGGGSSVSDSSSRLSPLKLLVLVDDLKIEEPMLSNATTTNRLASETTRVQLRSPSLARTFAMDLALACARSKVTMLAHRIREAIEVSRASRAAEATYHELSRLCDAELQRRGIDRQQVRRLVYVCLTGACTKGTSPTDPRRIP